MSFPVGGHAHYPGWRAYALILKLCPFVRIVDFYVLVGLATPVLLVHKGQICLNARADKGNPLLLQSLALTLFQVRLGYDGRHAGQLDETCLDSLKVG